MPQNAHILAVTDENGPELSLWAQVNPANSVENRIIGVIAPGEALLEKPVGNSYIGSVQLQGASNVYHVFELSTPLDTL